MQQVDLAYAAGFIEADGYIMIVRSKANRGTHGWSFHPRLGAVGQAAEPLQLLADLFGGRVRPQKPRGVDSRGLNSNKAIYQWCVTGNNKARLAIATLLPHMKIPRKIRRAKLALKLVDDAVWDWFEKHSKKHPMPLEEYRRRERLYKQCRGL